ncbi:MAG: hypothetical protein KKC19_03375 [Nanoarchaeota archaeon]|nr:hypothetical protein [Nanoarchaeota archaeon]
MKDLVEISLNGKRRLILGCATSLATLVFPVYIIGSVLIAEDREELITYLDDGYKILKWAYETTITGEVPIKEKRVLR